MNRSAMGMAWLLVLASSACDVGQPLVRSWPAREDGGVWCDVPECPGDPFPHPSQIAGEGRVSDVDLALCGATTSRVGCGRDPDDDTASTQSDEDAASASCVTAGDLGALRELDSQARECETLDFQVDAGSARRVRLEGLSLRHVNLTLRSRMPLEVRLDGAALWDVRVSLVGPVSLHVTKPDSFVDVRAVGSAGAHGAPALELEGIQMADVQIGEGSERFEGTVGVVRSSLSRWHITAADVRLESASLRKGWLDAQTLLVLDTGLTDVVVTADEAQVAASRLHRSLYASCGALALLGSRVEESHLVPCERVPLRIYASFVHLGAIDGPIEAVESELTRVRFGVERKTTLATWDTSINLSNYCAQATRHAASGGKIDCSACEGGLSKRSAACVLDASGVAVLSNACAAWDEPSACDASQERQRPHMGPR